MNCVINETMAANCNGANVENDRWKATTVKNDDKKKRYRPTTRMPEAASSETGNKEKFILKQSCGRSLEHGPLDIKRAKTVSSFKYAYRRHRENMVENA
jgi:hypothetical protein